MVRYLIEKVTAAKFTLNTAGESFYSCCVIGEHVLLRRDPVDDYYFYHAPPPPPRVARSEAPRIQEPYTEK